MAVLAPPLRQTIASSGAALSHTGDTDETALVSVPIPPMGPNNRLEVQLLWSYTNSGNSKTIRSKFHTAAGIGGTSVCSGAPTTTAALQQIFSGQNRNATNSQIWGPAAGGTTVSSTANVATTVDSSVGSFLNITVDLADAGETITLESYRIDIVRV